MHTLFYQSNTDPPQPLVDLWASLLETDSAAVTAWVEAEKAKLKSTELSNPTRGQEQTPPPPPPVKRPSAPPIELDPSRNILTPNSSTSPEPPPAPLPAALRSKPPTLVSPVHDYDQQQFVGASHSHSYINGPRGQLSSSFNTHPPFVKVEEERKPKIANLSTSALTRTRDPLRRNILLAIHKDYSDTRRGNGTGQAPYPHPKTREERRAVFDSCARPMEEFLEKVKSGSLERYGFKRGE